MSGAPVEVSEEVTTVRTPRRSRPGGSGVSTCKRVCARGGGGRSGVRHTLLNISIILQDKKNPSATNEHSRIRFARTPITTEQTHPRVGRDFQARRRWAHSRHGPPTEYAVRSHFLLCAHHLRRRKISDWRGRSPPARPEVAPHRRRLEGTLHRSGPPQRPITTPSFFRKRRNRWAYLADNAVTADVGSHFTPRLSPSIPAHPLKHIPAAGLGTAATSAALDRRGAPRCEGE